MNAERSGGKVTREQTEFSLELLFSSQLFTRLTVGIVDTFCNEFYQEEDLGEGLDSIEGAKGDRQAVLSTGPQTNTCSIIACQPKVTTGTIVAVAMFSSQKTRGEMFDLILKLRQ